MNFHVIKLHDCPDNLTPCSSQPHIPSLPLFEKGKNLVVHIKHQPNHVEIIDSSCKPSTFQQTVPEFHVNNERHSIIIFKHQNKAFTCHIECPRKAIHQLAIKHHHLTKRQASSAMPERVHYAQPSIIQDSVLSLGCCKNKHF